MSTYQTKYTVSIKLRIETFHNDSRTSASILHCPMPHMLVILPSSICTPDGDVPDGGYDAARSDPFEKELLRSMRGWLSILSNVSDVLVSAAPRAVPTFGIFLMLGCCGGRLPDACFRIELMRTDCIRPLGIAKDMVLFRLCFDLCI